MVRKIVISFVLMSQAASAATPGLLLRWKGDKSPRCQKLVESFLTELRSMASDQLIELEAVAAAAAQPDRRLVEMECAANTIKVNGNGHAMSLRYSQKASGFEALDWLPFQQSFLREQVGAPVPETPQSVTLASLAPASVENKSAPATMAQKIPETKSEKSIFQRWWFWGLVAGAVGGGVYALNQANSRKSSVNVEIQ